MLRKDGVGLSIAMAESIPLLIFKTKSLIFEAGVGAETERIGFSVCYGRNDTCHQPRLKFFLWIMMNTRVRSKSTRVPITALSLRHAAHQLFGLG